VCVTCHYRGSKILRQVTTVGTLRRMRVLQPAGTAGAAGTYLCPTIILIIPSQRPIVCRGGLGTTKRARTRTHTHTHTHPPTNTNKRTRTARPYTGRRHGPYVSYPPGGAVRWKKTPSRTGTHNNIVRSRIKNNSNNNIIMDVPIPSPPPPLLNRSSRYRSGFSTPVRCAFPDAHVYTHCYYYLRTIDARASSVFASLAFGSRYARCSSFARLQS